ncbi:hypothetical protein [Paenibacillus sp. PSB04]|uniref:hypothetical protein n=1 Tax=Paenibacillus sp. PSB04 TaxID=2866810 RepID=UPI0021F20438|nr:hypothetical protein [Paenibacillus sp. PSB04]UYO02608.1 hypothetical protein K2F33_23075 [Paenibacillus sp. PSB04]
MEKESRQLLFILISAMSVTALVVLMILSAGLFWDRNLRPSTMQEARVLLRSELRFPDEDQIRTVEVYDDKFMEPEIRIRYPNGLRLSVTRLRSPSPYPVLSHQKAVPSTKELRDDRTEKVVYRFVKDDFLYTLHGDVPEQVISETVLQIFRNE